jgi:hypothetical protein
MSADRWIPPTITFLGDQPERGMAVKFAYLVRIDGHAWAYADLTEVHKQPKDAKAFPLDESLIVEEPNSVTDRPAFAYRGMVPPSP